MKSPSDSASVGPLGDPAGELRLAWLILGAVLLWLFLPAGVTWVALATVPWALGAAVLASTRRAQASAATLALRGASPIGRVGLTADVGMVLILAHLLGAQGTGFVVAWCAAPSLLAGAFSAYAPITPVAASLLIACGVAELAARSAPVASRFGGPTEESAFKERYEGAWTRNLLGLRSPYERVTPEPGVRRILVGGDSFTWGDKVAMIDSVWPARLERELEEREPGIELEVINTAQRGWTTYNEAEYLQRIGWQFEPDLVLVQTIVNDALPSGPNFLREGRSGRRALLPDRFRQGAIRESSFLALLEGAWNGLSSDGSALAFYSKLYAEDGEGWRQMQDAFGRMGAEAGEARVPIVCVLFPYLPRGSSTAESYPFTAIHSKITETAVRSGFAVLDLTPRFIAEGGDWSRWWATPYDSHPNEAAHRLAATAIAEFLTRRASEGVLPFSAFAPSPRNPQANE